MPSIGEKKEIAERLILAEFKDRFGKMDNFGKMVAYETMIHNVLVRITLEDMKRWAEWAKIDLGELK